MAVEVIPFTLCSLLLCNDIARERAGAAQSPPPLATRAPGGKSPLRGTFGYSFRLIGDGRM
ncbi:hypothetical protein KIF59_14485 [Enterobacter cloacae subsp. cloacae]|nr:hypothetical protein [Enterobacter cloacae subsp. cloacae]